LRNICKQFLRGFVWGLW